MCGIAGWLGCLPDAETYAARLQQAMRHRGPDGHGAQLWADAGLVHTRLSILDLSPAGAQPITNEDGTVWAVFNGEIYNHKEIRRSLEARGHKFKGHSDSEVLPHLYEEEGFDFVARLRGMFALAIYDTRNQTLILARDRFGIKPLFYAPLRNRLVFASEIRALRELPDIDTRPDKQAIYDFAALLYIPAPETFYRGIRALQPGEVLEATLHGDNVCYNTRAFHRWTLAPDLTLTLHEATERADVLLTNAVRRQMESDVPLGTLLSGGIDSSLVSAAAQSALGHKLRTYNVRFAEKDFDETWAAMAVSKYIGSDHQTLDITNTPGTWEGITDLLSHVGQPFADTSLFAVNAVCRLMRKHVTVALSGDGGDEGFGGYDFYWRIARVARLQRLPDWLIKVGSLPLGILAYLDMISPSFPERFGDLVRADDISIVQQMFCWIREREHKALCIDNNLLPVRRLFEPQWQSHVPTKASRLERLSAHATEVNTRLMLPNDFLFKVDAASMRESVEVRVPMLDEDLFAFGLSLPHRLKVKNRTCKQILRAISQRKLPPIIANKSKVGFGIPIDTWVNGNFKECLRDVLLSRSSKISEFFRTDVYYPIVNAFCDGDTLAGISRQGLYQRAIMLLSLHVSLE
jgi:asparagine synthase (glutamine-hydrolysing)